MKIDLNRYSVVDEQAAFNALVDEFGEAMKIKFELKMEQGYSGWMDESDSELIPSLIHSLHQHVEKGGDQMIDVGNLAAMLWNLHYIPAAVEFSPTREGEKTAT